MIAGSSDEAFHHGQSGRKGCGAKPIEAICLKIEEEKPFQGTIGSEYKFYLGKIKWLQRYGSKRYGQLPGWGIMSGEGGKETKHHGLSKNFLVFPTSHLLSSISLPHFLW